MLEEEKKRKKGTNSLWGLPAGGVLNTVVFVNGALGPEPWIRSHYFFNMFTGEKKAAALWAVLSFYGNNNIYEGVKQVKE